MKIFKGKNQKGTRGAKIVTPLAFLLGVTAFPSALSANDCQASIAKALTKTAIPTAERPIVSAILCQRGIELSFYLNARFGKKFTNTHLQALEVIQAISDQQFSLGDYIRFRQQEEHTIALESAIYARNSEVHFFPNPNHPDFPF